MAMQINTNVLSLTAQRNAAASQASLSTAIERLSTGLRINSAGDDAAGLAISERFTSQIRGQTVAQRNANDAISFAQTAEGALSVMGDVLQRMRELTIQSLNGLNTDGDREALNQEVAQLREEVERIARDTTFNGRKILDGSLETMNFQIGAGRGDVLAMRGVNALAAELGSEKKSIVMENMATGIDYTAGYTDVFVNGVGVDLTNSNDQGDIIAAINAVSERTGVTASAETRVDLGALTAVAGTLTVNGTAVAVTADDDAESMMEKINGNDALDVTASLSESGTLVLTSSSGEDIVLEQGTDAMFANLNIAADDETFVSAIKLSSTGSDDISVTGTDAEDLGFDPSGTTTTASSLTEGMSIDSVSVETVAEANDALDALDDAIDQVTALRAELGAMQNRFENVIEVVGIHRENLEAARSRILDADFAEETANLTRAQILQQAGLASLAQANSVPQSVLSLLQ